MTSSLLIAALLLVAKPAPRSALLGGDWPAEVSGKKVTVQAKTANQALEQIAKAADWNLALNAGAAGSAQVQFSFHSVGVEEALIGVLSAAQLQATRVGDTVVVTPGPPPAAKATASAAVDGDRARDENDEPTAADEAAAAKAAPIPPAPPLPPGLPSAGLHKKHHQHSGHGDRVQMGDITIAENVNAGDVVAIGGNIDIKPNATVDQAVAVGGHVEIEQGAHVTSDVVGVGGSVHVGANAIVEGDVTSVGGSVEVDPTATVKGDQTGVGSGTSLGFAIPGLAFGLGLFSLISRLAQFVVLFSLGALLLVVAPNQLAVIETALLRRPLRAGVFGFLATLVAPVLAVLLVVTIVGIPLVAVEFFGLVMAALMGFTAAAVLVGRALRVPVRGGGLLGLAAGCAILVVLTALPVVGFLVLITGWFLMLGAALHTRFGSVPEV